MSTYTKALRGRLSVAGGIVAALVATAAPEPPQGFTIRSSLPCAGEAALVIETQDGRRVRNLVAQVERPAGALAEPWDLRDDSGAYVPPGRYRMRGIIAPPLELLYQLTPYPNVDQLWPDRTPWLQGHSGPHGWLSDHSQIQAAATRGDRLYFGAPMAEAGVCLIECEPSGRKLWGQNNFGAWLGVNMLAADADAVYIAATDSTVYRMDPATHQSRKLFQFGGAGRQGSLSGMAANAGHVYLAFAGGASDTSIDNATVANNIDLPASLPAHGPNSPDYWYGLVRALRLEGNPPGQRDGRLDLVSTKSGRRNQYLMLAFHQPVPLGAVAFPHPGGKEKITFSVLAPNAPYPPRATEEKDWVPFADSGRPGWNCLAAPSQTLTRGLRITFTREDYDDLDDALTDVPTGAKTEKKPGLDDEPAAAEPGAEAAGRNAAWSARLDGLKLIRRRFASLFPAAKARVSSGTVTADGAWDAARTAPVSRENPGIMLMEWDKPQPVCGLAIKEITAARTEIDVWQGPAGEPVSLAGPVLDTHSRETGWRQVATYQQKRRSAYNPSPDCNPFARYLDGYVDFGTVVETRAVRLRIVEPWFDNGDKNAECRRAEEWAHGVHYTAQPCARLDTSQCRVLGVAPLQHLGNESPAVAAAASERLEVHDGQTGALIRELPVRLGWHGLAFGPQGQLYAIEKQHQDIVRVDLETGRLTTVVAGCEPSVMTVGPDGLIYVFPWSDHGRKPIHVYDTAGKLQRRIGKPGGRVPGPWDPQGFKDVINLTVDAAGSLWVVECGNYPRRIVQFRTDGTFVKEILGNTFYGGGGGGVLSRYDATRAWFGPLEFTLDWATHTSRLSALVADSVDGDLVPVRVRGRRETYLVSQPLSMRDRQSHGTVYLYDEATHTVRLVAAVGDATEFLPLRTSKTLALLKGGVPKYFTFLWSDRNGNGQVDAEEVDFRPKANVAAFEAVGPFDSALGCLGAGVRYDVKEFLPNGVPIYQRLPAPPRGLLRLDNGNVLALHTPVAEGAAIENYAVAPTGQKLWGYPTGPGGVGGLNVPPWYPGRVCNQFAIIGHETAPEGDLGEFVVVHANSGEWNIWTADGLLAGQVLLDKSHPRSKLFGPAVAKPGMRLDPLSASQEHFHGFFTRYEADNRYAIVAGFTHMSILEVKGLDKYRRVATEFAVTAADIESARQRESQQRAPSTGSAGSFSVAAVYVATPPEIDGLRGPHEWPGKSVGMGQGGDATFSITHDDKQLYLCWTGKGLGGLRNRGTEFQRLFKTGACLDFCLGTDAAADSARAKPVAGDLRLLIAFGEDQRPQAVLYQPVCPSAKAGEGWRTRTEAGGETAFDRVVLLPGAEIAMRSGGNDEFTVEAAMPLRVLGIQALPAGKPLKMDWGVLASRDGNQVKQRLYWANRNATGTSDEAIEARLEPRFWGNVTFAAPSEAVDGLEAK